MRIVRFDAQERVDLPDITQMSFLVLGEFRRQARGLLLGPRAGGGHPNYIVRGFAVEAQDVPDATIRVRLQIAGQPLGFAIGAEHLESRVDFGQLIGGDGMDGTLEGNAVQALDFTGQPPATYRVQMRFVYSASANDNRAFWDEGANSEFISATDTRHIPLIELRFGGAASDEWIDLADVVWDGSTIEPGDITDLRTFMLEGQAPFEASSHADSGIYPDFDRSADRAANGAHEIVPMLRALARQVLDLKGADDSGKLSWYGRTMRPLDPNGALPAGQTRSLRTLATTTYTVGDGVTSWGDFNGPTGLDDALSHIAAMPSSTQPERVEIVVHGSAPVGGMYTISGQKTILGRLSRSFTLTIRSGVKNDSDQGSTEGRPKIVIDGDSLGANEVGLFLDRGANLILRDLSFEWAGTTAAGRGMIRTDGYIDAQRCHFEMSAAGMSPAADAGFALSSATAKRCRIEHCLVRGRMRFYGAEDVALPPGQGFRGTVAHCELEEAQLALHGDGDGGVFVDIVNGFTIRDCQITGRTAGVYSGTIALIDGRSAQHLAVERCSIHYSPNENAIDGRDYGDWLPLAWRIVDCDFVASQLIGGTMHPVDGGSGTTNGTGWAVSLDGGVDDAAPTRGHVIRGCRVAGVSVDAGGFRLHHCRAPKVEGCDFDGCGNMNTPSGTSYTAILISAEDPGYLANAIVTSTTIHRWSTGANRTRGLRLENVDTVLIQGCIVRGDSAGSDIIGRSASAVAVWLENANSVTIVDSAFAQWEPAGTVSRCIVHTTGTRAATVIKGCHFKNTGNFAIDLADDASGYGPTITSNRIQNGANINQKGISVTVSAGTAAVNDNAVGTTGSPGISLAGNLGSGVCMGNAVSGTIQKTGTGTWRGYNETGQDLNRCSSYT